MNVIRKLATVIVALGSASVAHAGLISGFEQGLDGWDYIGDVSIQTADIGTTPTQAQKMAIVTTLCDWLNPPVQSSCDTVGRELPYSGVSSPDSRFADEFLNNPGLYRSGEGGALKTQFYAPQPGFLSFDWNYVGEPGDFAYLSLWSSDGLTMVDMAEHLYPGFQLGFDNTVPRFPTDVEVCSRVVDLDPDHIDLCANTGFYGETGWQTKSVEVSESGWYWIGFGMSEIAEGSVPSLLALDNVRYKVVPEPGTLALLSLGLLGMGLARRRKA